MSRLDSGRKADIQQLTQLIRNPNTPHDQRKQAEQVFRTIANQSGLVTSMRERLIKEMRAGRSDNVKDIHDYIKGKAKYQ